MHLICIRIWSGHGVGKRTIASRNKLLIWSIGAFCIFTLCTNRSHNRRALKVGNIGLRRIRVVARLSNIVDIEIAALCQRPFDIIVTS